MKNWFLWLAAGVLSFIGGLTALGNPLAASMTVEMLAAWSFVFSGIVMLVSAWSNQSGGARIVALLFAAAVLLLGIFLLNNPLKGLVSLTVVAGFMLLAAGIARLLWAFKTSGGARTALLVSAVLSLLLGAMIFNDFPASAVSMLGLFLAVELLSNGVSLVMMALAARRLNNSVRA